MDAIFALMANEKEQHDKQKLKEHVMEVARQIRNQKDLPDACRNTSQFQAREHHCSTTTCSPQNLAQTRADRGTTTSPSLTHHGSRQGAGLVDRDVFVCRFGAVHVCCGQTRLEDCIEGTVPCRFEKVGQGCQVCMLTGRDYGSVINNTIVGTPRGHIVGKRRSNLRERLRADHYTSQEQAATSQAAASGAAELKHWAVPVPREENAISRQQSSHSRLTVFSPASPSPSPSLFPFSTLSKKRPRPSNGGDTTTTTSSFSGRAFSRRPVPTFAPEPALALASSSPLRPPPSPSLSSSPQPSAAFPSPSLPAGGARISINKQYGTRRPLSRQARQRLRQKTRERHKPKQPWEVGEERWKRSEARNVNAKRREAESILRALLKPSRHAKLMPMTQSHLKTLKQAAKAMSQYRQHCAETRQHVSCYEELVLFLIHGGHSLIAPAPISSAPPSSLPISMSSSSPSSLSWSSNAGMNEKHKQDELKHGKKELSPREAASQRHYADEYKKKKDEEERYVMIQYATNIVMAHWRMVVMTFENSMAQVTIGKFRQLVMAVIYQMRQPDGLVWYERCIIPHSAYLKRWLPDESHLDRYASRALPELTLRDLGRGRHMLNVALKTWDAHVPYDDLIAAFTDPRQHIPLSTQKPSDAS